MIGDEASLPWPSSPMPSSPSPSLSSHPLPSRSASSRQSRESSGGTLEAKRSSLGDKKMREKKKFGKEAKEVKVFLINKEEK